MTKCNSCFAEVPNGYLHFCGDVYTPTQTARIRGALNQITDQEIKSHMPTANYQNYFDYVENPILHRTAGGAPQPPKPVKKDYNTVSVKFISGHNVAKSYTYRVPKKAKLRLGQEVVVPTKNDGCITNTIAVVVELHKTPQDTGAHDYKFVLGTVKPL
jgi:3'DNA-binding domain (3'BD)